MKKCMSIILTLLMMCSLICAQSFAATVAESDDSVIWHDEFSSDKSYSLADTGVVSDGAYAMTGGARIIKNVSKFVAGAYEVEATYNFSVVSKVDGLLRIGDNTGNYYATYVDVDGGKMQLRQISSGGITPTATHELLTVQTGTDYTVKLRFSLDSKELEIYINGTRYLAEKLLQINADCPNIYRAFDCQPGDSSAAKFTIDNLIIRKINWNPLEHGSVIFEEDFEGGYGSGYAAKPSGTTSIETLNDSDAFLYSSNRLTTQHTIGKGKINLSLDLTLSSIASNSAIIIQSSDSNGSPVWRLRVNKSGELYGDVATAKGETSIGEMNSGKLATLNLNTTYKLAVEYDTETKVMNVYVNGIKCNTENIYIKTNSTNYNRVLDENPDYLGTGNATFYLDNIKIVKKQSDSIEKIFYSDKAMTIASDERGLQTVSSSLVDSSSVFGVETYITFTTVENSSSTRGIMAPQTVSGSSVYEIFGLYEKDGALLVRTFMEKDSTSSYEYLPLIDAIEEGRTYSFGYLLNLSTKRIHFFVDGKEMHYGYQLYMNPACVGSFVRPIDFNNNGTIGANVVTVDGYLLYKDNALTNLNFDGIWQNGELTLPSTASDETTAITWYSGNVTAVTSLTGEAGSCAKLSAVFDAGSANDARSFVVYFPSDETAPTLKTLGNIISAEVKNEDASSLYFALYKAAGNTLTLESVTIGGHCVNNSHTLSLNSLGYLEDGSYVIKAFYWKNEASVPNGIGDEISFTVSNGNVAYNS